MPNLPQETIGDWNRTGTNRLDAFFPKPNQQCQGTEWNSKHCHSPVNITSWLQGEGILHPLNLLWYYILIQFLSDKNNRCILQTENKHCKHSQLHDTVNCTVRSLMAVWYFLNSHWLKCIKHQCNKLMYATDMPVANDGWLMQSTTKYQGIGYSVKKVLTISQGSSYRQLEFNVPFQHKYGYIRDKQGSRASCLRSLMMDFITNFTCCLKLN